MKTQRIWGRIEKRREKEKKVLDIWGGVWYIIQAPFEGVGTKRFERDEKTSKNVKKVLDKSQ